MKLPRTIRLDPSDAFVFAEAAEPGEWAVSGAFRFFGADPEQLGGKARQALRAGFLGLSSFGWSTLAVVSEASAAEQEAATALLARQLVRHLGAPDEATARAAAEEEIAFAATLCDHEVGTILAVERSLDGEGIRERFRTLHRRQPALDPARAFVLLPVEEEDEEGETVDLVKLAETRP